jgi:hypothetical protein
MFSCTKPDKRLGEQELLNTAHYDCNGMPTLKLEKNLIFPTLSSSNSLATCGISGVM